MLVISTAFEYYFINIMEPELTKRGLEEKKRKRVEQSYLFAYLKTKGMKTLH